MSRCGLVIEDDDGIGEIRCSAELLVYGTRATCERGHRWVVCDCDEIGCPGWKVAPDA